MVRSGIFFNIIFIVFSSSAVFSQGEFLEKGESGVGVNAGWTSNKDASGFGGTAGYSTRGTVDIDMSYSHSSTGQQLNGYGLSVDSYTPSLTVHIKPDSSSGIPVFASISTAYEIDSYSSEALYGLTAMSSRGFTIGASISCNIGSPMAYCQPSIGFSHVFSTIIFDGQSTNVQANLFLFGLSYVFKISPTTSVAIEPAVAVANNELTFSISAGFVFGIHH